MPLVLEFTGDAKHFERVLSAATKAGATKVKVLEQKSVASASKMTAAFGQVNKILGPLGMGLGLAVALRGIKQIFLGTIEARDEIAKFSRATGIAVETMSAMQFAAERSGSSLEGFQKGAKGLLIQMQGVKDGMAESQRAFDQLGVTVLNESGNLRGFEDVFGDIAQALSEMSNETEKAAIAQRVFGKSGLALVPLLESGKQGIKDLTDEAERLGIVFGEIAAKQAEEAADALTNFGTASKALGQNLAANVLPFITDWADGMTTLITGFDQMRLRALVWQKDQESNTAFLDRQIQALESQSSKLKASGAAYVKAGKETEAYKEILDLLVATEGLELGSLDSVNRLLAATIRLRNEETKAVELNQRTKSDTAKEEDPAKFAERIALIGKQEMAAVKARIATRKEESSIFKNQLAARAQALRLEKDLGQLIKESGLRAKEELDEVIEKLAFIREQEKLLADTALFWRRDLVLVKELTVGISNAISNALINAQNLGDALEQIIRQLASRALAGLIGGGFASLFGLGAFGAVFGGISGFQGGGRFTVPGPDTGADNRFVMIRTRGQEQITAQPASQVTHQRFDSGVTIQRLEITTRSVDEQFVRFELLPLLNRLTSQGSRLNASGLV